MPKQKQPIDMFSLLDSTSGTLAHIRMKTNFLKKLTSIVRQNCPDLPADAWHIANFKQNIIIIEVITSVWGQRLQFERTKLTQAIAMASDQQFTKIEIKINPFWAKSVVSDVPVQPIRQHKITDAAAEHIKQAASNAPESLKIKLLRLAALSQRD